MMAFLFGVACGTVTGHKKTYDKKDGVKCIMLTQDSQALTIMDATNYDAALFEETQASYDAPLVSLVDNIRDITSSVLGHIKTVSSNDVDIGYIVPYSDTG